MKDSSSAYKNLDDMETVVHHGPVEVSAGTRSPLNLQAVAESTTSDLQSAINSVWKALNSDRYDWRSVDGLAEETGLNKLAVSTILESELGGAVVRSVDANQPRRFLYATRERYNKVRGPWNRVLSVITNQVK
jgi:hypothetical protein